MAKRDDKTPWLEIVKYCTLSSSVHYGQNNLRIIQPDSQPVVNTGALPERKVIPRYRRCGKNQRKCRGLATIFNNSITVGVFPFKFILFMLLVAILESSGY